VTPHLADPVFFWILLAALPAAIAFFYWSWRVKQKLITQFIRARLLGSLTVGVSPRRQMVRLGLVIAALCGILLALARPQWGFVWEDSRQRGLDIMVVMDTSKSMLAKDVVPNRLEKAKLAAYDLMKLAKTDRLGLVAFAGTAFLQAPLTLDDEAFRQGIAALDVGIIPQGGTAISTAIHTAVASFEKNNDNHKVIVLFTDGEDHDADTETLAAARQAAEAGVHIFTIGVGTPAGELLRVKDEHGNYNYVKDDDGNVVKSRLNQPLLQEIATTANGFYLPLQGANPMETLYARGLAPLPKGESTTRRSRVPIERYHWFLGFAAVCLLLEFMLPESPRPRRTETAVAPTRTAAQTVVAALCLMLAVTTGRASPSSAFSEYQSGNFKAAYDEYSRLADKNTNDYRLHYDAGAAAYRAKKLEEAEKQFNATLGTATVAPDIPTQERTYYNLGNTEYHLGEPLTEPDKKEERWKQAIDSYVQALRLNTNDVDAKNNLAFVRKKLEELKQQQQQQQKQQNKNQQDKDKNQQQQQQSQSSQDQQKQQNQQNHQQQASSPNQKNDQNKKSEQDKNKDQQQQQQAQSQKDKDKQNQERQQNPTDQRDKNQEQEAQEAAAAGRMTPEEARQILAEQKDDEKALVFQPEKEPPKTQSGKFKDW
jgi:Ca-activated chloride channel homolog